MFHSAGNSIFMPTNLPWRFFFIYIPFIIWKNHIWQRNWHCTEDLFKENPWPGFEPLHSWDISKKIAILYYNFFYQNKIPNKCCEERSIYVSTAVLCSSFDQKKKKKKKLEITGIEPRSVGFTSQNYPTEPRNLLTKPKG